MKNLFTLLFILIVVVSSYSQNISLNGQVKDKITSESISYCSILIMQNDSTKYFAITDDIGKFNIPINPGKYSMILRFLGYKTDTLQMGLISHGKSLGIIYLESDLKLLNEVVVTEHSKKSLIDKEETIVTKKLKAGTATASDLLDKVNGVSYDRYNNQIKVDNETNVLLLVNGLEKNQNYIKNISPNRIAKVEVIRDPSGKYGLEGYSSIINIKLKKNYVGQEVFLGIQSVIDIDSPTKEHLIPQNNLNSSYNFTRKSLNIYSNLWIGKTNVALIQNLVRKYDDSLTVLQKNIAGNTNFNVENINSNITIGADYQFSPKHTVSFEGELTSTINDKTKSSYLIQNKINNTIVKEQNYSSENSNPSNYYSGTLFYLGNISQEKSLNIDFTIGGDKSNSKTNFRYDKLSEIQNIIEGSSNYIKSNIEWNHTIGSSFSYQAGYGNTWKKSHNKLFNSDSENPSKEYELIDFRNRAFLYGTWKIAKEVTLKTGVAIENSLPKLDNQKQSYWIYKPHLDLQYKPLSWLGLKLKYRADENYPSLSEANPIEVALDQYTVQTGNPSLKPSTTHKTSLTASIMHGLASVTLFYDYSKDYISPVGNLKNNGIFEYSYDNLGGYKHKGIKFNFTIPFSNKIILQNNAKFYNSEMKYKGHNNNFNDWRAESQLMYIDGKSGMWAGLMLQKSNAKIITPQGYRQGNNDFWALIIQKPFLKKKLSVMILYMLPINWVADYTQDNYLESPSYSQLNTVDLNLLKNVAVLRVNYRFHKGRDIKTIKKKIEREKAKKSGGIF